MTSCIRCDTEQVPQTKQKWALCPPCLAAINRNYSSPRNKTKEEKGIHSKKKPQNPLKVKPPSPQTPQRTP